MIRAKKSLGQNFLTSSKALDDMVRAAKVSAGETVLEIGPGKGALTERLLAAGARVVAVEKDDRLIPYLSEKFEKEIMNHTLRLIHADVLDYLASRERIDTFSDKYKVVANIPYYITGQLIRLFLESNPRPMSITILVQKEVAERIVAKEGKESLLSLSVKAYGSPTYVRTVPRGAFSPRPEVDSAILHIRDISKRYFSENKISEKDFFSLLHAGFAHKRKQLFPNISEIYGKSAVADAFTNCNLNRKVRAEDMDLSMWRDLLHALCG